MRKEKRIRFLYILHYDFTTIAAIFLLVLNKISTIFYFLLGIQTEHFSILIFSLLLLLLWFKDEKDWICAKNQRKSMDKTGMEQTNRLKDSFKKFVSIGHNAK